MLAGLVVLMRCPPFFLADVALVAGLLLPCLVVLDVVVDGLVVLGLLLLLLALFPCLAF